MSGEANVRAFLETCGRLRLWDREIKTDFDAAAFLATPESDQDEVQELYHRFLHRQADAAGLMAFENALQHSIANEQVTAVLLGSDEYFQLAQQ